MKQFMIIASHDMYEDSYSDGEGRFVDSYTREPQIVKAPTAQEAVAMFVQSYIGDILLQDINFEFEDAYVSRLIDRDGSDATASEIEKWKENKMDLYSDNVTMKVYEINKVTFTK